MQVKIKLTEEWQDLNGITGVDGTGATVAVSLTSGTNIKGYPLAVTSNYEWYQGASAPANDNFAIMPIYNNAQFFATYDGTENFYMRVVKRFNTDETLTAECILIITQGA